MKIVFRTDASLEIGTGHVMRCLTLADALRKRGADCSFICRPHEGHLFELIAQHKHHCQELPILQEDVSASVKFKSYVNWFDDATDTQRVLKTQMADKSIDWLVIDHYALGRSWEHTLKPYTRRIMVIDDLANRAHDCDLLLDQNLGRVECDYGGLLMPGTVKFIGPQYALLRPDFAEMRAQSLARREKRLNFQNLIISIGGVDKENATGKVLDVLKNCVLPHDLRIMVVMGPHSPWLSAIKEKATQLPWPTQVLAGVSNIAQLMAESDLAIGAAGGTAWERCCLGLPSILLAQAENQVAGAVALGNAGAAILLKRFEQIEQVLNSWQLSGETAIALSKLSHAAAKVTDGNGSARVAAYMVDSLHA